jgi:hypothetical protein
MRLMVDMFAGLGGASEAMIHNDNWVVYRFDNNKLLSDVEYMNITNDMFNVVKECPHNVDLIWASPPCRQFSNAYNSPKSQAKRFGKYYYPELELLQKTIETIKYVKPKTWVIENVIGSIEYFLPFLGEPRQIIGSVVLWGNFPLLPLPANFKHLKDDSSWSTDPLRANKRAKIPYEISESLRDTLDYQKTLEEWI